MTVLANASNTSGRTRKGVYQLPDNVVAAKYWLESFDSWVKPKDLVVLFPGQTIRATFCLDLQPKTLKRTNLLSSDGFEVDTSIHLCLRHDPRNCTPDSRAELCNLTTKNPNFVTQLLDKQIDVFMKGFIASSRYLELRNPNFWVHATRKLSGWLNKTLKTWGIIIYSETVHVSFEPAEHLRSVLCDAHTAPIRGFERAALLAPILDLLAKAHLNSTQLLTYMALQNQISTQTVILDHGASGQPVPQHNSATMNALEPLLLQAGIPLNSLMNIDLFSPNGNQQG
jgi:hypothetical protein